MQRLMTATCLFLATQAVAALPPSAVNNPKNSPEAKAARLERRMRRTGGMLEDFREYKGHFKFLDSQKIVAPADVEELTVGTMKTFFRAHFSIETSPRFSVAEAKDLMKRGDAKAAVFLVDDPSLPTLLASPEENWSAVNVAKLNADKPEADLLHQRVRREMWRGLCYALGCVSPADVCVMKPVNSLKDLDDLSANAPSRYPLADVQARLPAVGIGSIRTLTYRKACEEGWAPAPTNDYQKAVWDEVRTLPSDPIQIKYDPKRDK